MYLDWTYVLVLIGAVISMIASANVKSTFRRYSSDISRSGKTADEVAKEVLNGAGIYDVAVEHVGGDLTDHYSSSDKKLRLSDTVYGSRSVAAIGVAAHEAGHAIQDKEQYGPLALRHAAVPIANIGSKLSWPIILAGLIFSIPTITRIGILFFCFVVAFQLITLPVEFDASKRALSILEDRGILEIDEMSGAEKVLKAAALTYVAAAFSAILQLLRLILLVQGRGGKRRKF